MSLAGESEGDETRVEPLVSRISARPASFLNSVASQAIGWTGKKRRSFGIRAIRQNLDFEASVWSSKRIIAKAGVVETRWRRCQA